jgi:hypothetical protein
MSNNRQLIRQRLGVLGLSPQREEKFCRILRTLGDGVHISSSPYIFPSSFDRVSSVPSRAACRSSNAQHETNAGCERPVHRESCCTSRKAFASAGDRRSHRRPSRGRSRRCSQDRAPECPPPAKALRAPSDSHREKSAGKIDLLRQLLSAGDMRVSTGDGRHAFEAQTVHSGGSAHDLAGSRFFTPTGSNTDDLDQSGCRGKTPPGTEESDTPADERLWNENRYRCRFCKGALDNRRRL